MSVRKRPVTELVNHVVSGGADDWGSRGQPFRWDYVNLDFLGHPINPESIISEKVKQGHCKLIILGSSHGEDIPQMIQSISQKIGETISGKLTIDTFNLRDVTVAETKKLIHQDHTPDNPTPFEHHIQPDMVGAYDVVLAQQSVGWHTLEPSWVLIKAAKLLQPDGYAFIEHYPELMEIEPQHRLRKHHQTSTPIVKIKDTVTRYWRSKNTDEYEIDNVDVNVRDRQTWFIIHRTNKSMSQHPPK